MSRISCNVTKDLLPSYLDAICSEESKELVEEHLQECTSCKAFMGMLQGKDLGRDAQKVDFLKKTSRFVERRSLYGIIATMSLLAVILFGRNSGGGGTPFWALAVGMPALMLIYAYVLASTKRIAKRGTINSNATSRNRAKFTAENTERVILVLESVCIVAAIVIQLLALYWIRDDGFRPCPLYELGPLMSRSAICIVGVSILLLFILYQKARKKSFYSLVCQNMVLLVMHLCVSFDDMLHRMETPESLFLFSARSTGILLLEFVVFMGVLLFVCRRAEKQSLDENTTDFRPR